MRISVLVGLLAMPAMAMASDESKLKPGEYEVKMRLELPHVENNGVEKLEKVCITNGGTHGIVVLSENNPLARCPSSNIKEENGDLSFELVCAGHNQAIARARFELWPDRFVGAFEMKMGGKNMTMTERQSARRIGDCATPPS